MNIRDLVEEAGYSTHKKTYSPEHKSDEYSSPCPFCTEGDDRFQCWPDELNRDGTYSGGRYWCRKCKCSGDALNFLKAMHGYDYKEACAYLKLMPTEMTFTAIGKVGGCQRCSMKTETLRRFGFPLE